MSDASDFGSDVASILESLVGSRRESKAERTLNRILLEALASRAIGCIKLPRGPVGVGLAGHDGGPHARFTWASKVLCDLLGGPLEGTPVRDRIPHEERSAHDAGVARLEDSDESHYMGTIQRRNAISIDGSVVPVAFLILMFREAPRTFRYAVIMWKTKEALP